MTGRRRICFSSMRSDRLLEVGVLAAVEDALAHDVPRLEVVEVLAIGNPAADDVAVRYHADEAIVLADGHRADVVLPHQTRELADGSIRRDPLRPLVHRFP